MYNLQCLIIWIVIYIFVAHGWTVLLIWTRIGCKLNGFRRNDELVN